MSKENKTILMKDKITLEGVEETMFIPLIARAIESKRKNPAFIDEVAVRVMEELNYDFSKYKAKMNIWGCATRTVIFDNEAREFIEANPNCTVINIASGLDNRFSRADNGQIQWYNIDLDNIINLRKGIFNEHNRVTDIACSALDYTWIDKIKERDNVLVIAEGIVMYFTEDETAQLFNTIARSFSKVTALVEVMSTKMVERQNMHEVTKTTSARFIWGLPKVCDFEKLCGTYSYVREHNFTDGMKHYSPIFITLISPILRKLNNSIGVFVKKQ